MENLKSLFDLTKLPAKFFFLFSVLSGFILFADKKILQKIHLEKINDSYGWIIGLVFISTTGLVFVNFVIWIFKKVSDKVKFGKVKKEYLERLKSLDFHEKAVIREFAINGKSSIEVPLDDATISGLIEKKILAINRSFGNSFIMSGMDASVSLNKFAEKHLTPKDIDLTESPTPTQAEIDFVKSNRPDWANKGW